MEKWTTVSPCGHYHKNIQVTHGRPVVVISVAVPVNPQTPKEIRLEHMVCHAAKDKTKVLSRRTICPCVLGAGVPILAVQAESKQIPIGVICDARGCTDSTGGNEKSGDGEQ